ncbi:MAG TPA: hypothetical protein VNG90_05135, partial [Candidatus Acidoferrum sp.]|nr:hypothetical protein [Candidatus Acidoferrum sp.]
MELQELLQTIAEELPPQASCINAIEGAELTWLKVRTSTDVEYATLEALRLDWQTRAGREIAIETFRYSPELDPMVIRTVMGITPSVPIIQAILLSENDGQKRLTIHTTDMRMLLGRQYQIYHALCGFLPEYEIILAPARSDWRSPNLPAVQQVLFDSKGDHELLKKVRKQLPHDLQVTHVGVNKYGTLHVFYMNWQMPGGELWKIRRELSATFNRNVYFALDVRWAKKLIGPYLEDGIEVYVCRDRIIRIMPRFDRLNPQTIASARRIAAKAYEELGLPIVVGVGSRRLIADLYSMLPLMVMQSGEAIIRQDRITGTITITCTSEVHRRLLEEFAQEMSPQLHLPIRVVMLLKATERNQLIRKLVPTAWGLKKAL